MGISLSHKRYEEIKRRDGQNAVYGVNFIIYYYYGQFSYILRSENQSFLNCIWDDFDFTVSRIHKQNNEVIP